MKEDPYQSPSKFTESFDYSDEKFRDDESSRRLSQFLKGLPNPESPSLKFEWNRLLLGPDPWRVSMNSNLSSNVSTPCGSDSARVSTERQISEQVKNYSLNPNPYNFIEYSLNPKFNLNLGMKLCDRNSRQPIIGVSGFELEEDSPVSLKKNIDVASENSPDLGLSESKQEDYISLEEYSDLTDNIEFPCEKYLSGIDETRGDIHKHNLSSEEDSKILLTRKEEHKQCLDEPEHSNERYATLVKPISDIQKKSSKIIDLSKVISSDATHFSSEQDSKILLTSKEEHKLCLDESKHSNEIYATLMKPIRGDVHKHNLSSEEDSKILLTSKEEHKQCLYESKHSNERYATLLKPIRDIQKKSSKIIDLSKVISSDATHFIRRGPTEVNGRFIRGRSSENSEEFKPLVNLSRIDEALGDIHKVNLSSEEDSELLLPSKHEHKQCLDESRRSNQRCPALLLPKCVIQKKASKIINLSKVISTDTNHLTRRCPKTVNARITRWRDSENLEEYTKLVNSAFLKYFKQLNENSAQRKSFTENSGCMKCNVCGSDSKVFKDCESLIAHAFGCKIPELRLKHLGFHKALCALMGWKSGTHLDKSWRYHKMLSDDEALALKEDLIIWPPVVLIHNSSIQNKNPDDRIVVSNEELCIKLKEMGYAGSVCRGKPANQSIMVVQFNNTLHGLQEAERLHKYYCANNHGRSDLQQDEVSTVNSKTESVLFGYLGLAEDLHKLDFETKKRCSVKSKKEFQEMLMQLFHGRNLKSECEVRHG